MAGNAGTTKLFVGNLAHGETKDYELREAFEMYGIVTECSVLSDYAFVHFETPQQAQHAKDQLNGRMFKGRRLKVDKSTTVVRTDANRITGGDGCYICQETDHWAKNCPQRPEGAPPRRTRQDRLEKNTSNKNIVTTKLFVGNLIRGTSNEELKGIFDQFGSVTECSVVSDYAFVHYATPSEADNALERARGMLFKGTRLKVDKSTSFVKRSAGDILDKHACYVCKGRDHMAKHCPTIPIGERHKQQMRAAEKRKADDEGDLFYELQAKRGYPPRPRPRMYDYYDDDDEEFFYAMMRRRRPPPGYYDDLEEYEYRRREMLHSRMMRDPYDDYDFLPPPRKRRPPPAALYDSDHHPGELPLPARRALPLRRPHDYEEYDDMYGLPPRPYQPPQRALPSVYRDEHYEDERFNPRYRDTHHESAASGYERSYQPRSEFDDRPGTSAYPAYDDRPARAAYRGNDDRPVRAAYGAYDSRSERATGSVYDNRPARTTYSVHEVTDYGRPHQHPPRQGTADPYARRHLAIEPSSSSATQQSSSYGAAYTDFTQDDVGSARSAPYYEDRARTSGPIITEMESPPRDERASTGESSGVSAYHHLNVAPPPQRDPGNGYEVKQEAPSDVLYPRQPLAPGYNNGY